MKPMLRSVIVFALAAMVSLVLFFPFVAHPFALAAIIGFVFAGAFLVESLVKNIPAA